MATTTVVPTIPHAVNGTTPHPTPLQSGPAEADLSATVMQISPSMALDLLRNRPKNRSIVKSHIRALISDIRAGKWCLNGESIVLTADLELIDGQHRLMAIAEAGITVPCLVAVGVPHTAIATIDQSLRHAASDTLAVHGLPQSKALAAACTWVERYESSRMRCASVRIPNSDLRPFVEAHAGLPDALPWSKRLAALLPGSCAVALVWLMSQRDAELAERFFTELSTGLQLEPDNPVHTVRQRLIKERATRASHISVVEKAASLTLAWNCSRRGKSMPAGLSWRGVSDASVAFPTLL